MKAHLRLFGPFAPELADCMEYPAEHYQDVRPGTPVTTTLFHCATGDAAQSLAEAFDIDPWDFAHHHLNSEQADFPQLARMSSEDLPRLLRLLEANWTVLYQPDA